MDEKRRSRNGVGFIALGNLEGGLDFMHVKLGNVSATLTCHNSVIYFHLTKVCLRRIYRYYTNRKRV